MDSVIDETMLRTTSKELQRLRRIDDPTAAINEPDRECLERLPRQAHQKVIVECRGDHRFKEVKSPRPGMDETRSLVAPATLERPEPR